MGSHLPSCKVEEALRDRHGDYWSLFWPDENVCFSAPSHCHVARLNISSWLIFLQSRHWSLIFVIACSRRDHKSATVRWTRFLNHGREPFLRPWIFKEKSMWQSGTSIPNDHQDLAYDITAPSMRVVEWNVECFSTWCFENPNPILIMTGSHQQDLNSIRAYCSACVMSHKHAAPPRKTAFKNDISIPICKSTSAASVIT